MNRKLSGRSHKDLLWANIFFLLLLIISCGQQSEEDSFEKQMEKARQSVANTDFSLSTYSSDSSKFWRVSSEIKSVRKSNKWSTVIINDFRQNNSSVGEVNNEFEGKASFLGQEISTDSADRISMCYLIRNEQGVSSIYKVYFVINGKSEITKIDSAGSGEWEKIKASITSKE